MAATAKLPIARSVTCHAWNKDATMIALSPNNHEVWIFKTNGQEDYSKWEKKYVLSEHSEHVSSVDWSPHTNMIVSCGHDRNAYVWRFDAASDEWKPTLVILRINRAATSVKWSPYGNKFAVASGAKCVPVCHYEASNDWWISKMIKKHKSTVVDVAWCPNNKFLVTGACDNKCRIFSAYVKEVDDAEDDGFGAVWPNQHEFGETLAEFDDARAWVNAVAWSPNGFRLAFAGHGSTVSFVQITADSQPYVQTVNCSGLPFLALTFVNDSMVIGAGFDNNPTVFKASSDDGSAAWSFVDVIDKEEQKDSGAKKTTGFDAVRSKFSDATNKGVVAAVGASVETVLKTRHQNTIISMCIPKSGVITTASIDGQVLFWKL